MAPTESQKSRKVCERDKNPPKPKQPAAKPGPKPVKNLPSTFARYEKDERREDLTYSDWVDVFDYWDEHPKMSQMAVVKYFSSRPDAEGVCPLESDEWEDIFVDPNAPDSDDSDDDVEMPPAVDSASSSLSNTAPLNEIQRAWDVILDFATTDMTYPQAKSGLQSVLSSGYVPAEWETALEAVMNAEENTVVAEQAVRALMPADFSPVSGSPGVPAPFANDLFLKEAERELSEVLVQMKDRRCVCREIPSLDELLDPMAEHEDLDAQYLRFSDGKDGITEILEYMKAGEADGDEGEEEEPVMELDFDKKEVLAAAELLERALRFRPDFEVALPLGNQLRKFRGELKQEIEENKVQTQISSFFSPVV
ncbi:hypothetical protein B0H14DRAFT_3467871 [Mycena olivaceomarginata]|nr:hypothetical protein B0H14DRAFT_3467871 [Mycena olivaceomarginata]